MEDQYKDLLARYLAGSATLQELAELEKLHTPAYFRKHFDGRVIVDLQQGGPYRDEAVTPAVKVRAEAIRELILAEAGEVREDILGEDPDDLEAAGRTRTFSFVWAAAAAVALFIAAGVWLYSRGPEIIVPEEHALQAAAFTGRQFISLPDGSTVLLNDGSELRFEADYGQGTREVFLTGEGYFDVTHDPARAFVVHAGGIKTTVLGTAFNVRAYAGQQEVLVTVTRGKVAVGDEVRVYDEILPDEQLAVNTATNSFEKTTLEVEEALVWKSNFFVLDDVTMQEAARLISERFNVSVTIENSGLKDCIVNGAFLNDESLEHVVATVCIAMEASYKQDSGRVTIEGGVTCE